MEGAVLKSQREYDMAVAHAWHGAMFGALAQSGKLKGLSSYIGNRAGGKKSTAAAAVMFFQALKAAGLPVTITKVERKEPSRGGL
jgi:hypothetical protein